MALLDDLLDDLILVCGAKLVLKLAITCGVENTLFAVPGDASKFRLLKLCHKYCASCHVVQDHNVAGWTTYSGIMILNPATTWARGMLESPLYFLTASSLSTKTVKTSPEVLL